MNSPETSPLSDHEPGGEPGERVDSVDEAGAPADPATDKATAGIATITDEERVLVEEPPTLCLNCGARLPGAYCPRCGQRAQSLRVPAWRFVRDSLSELFGLDGRVWRTYGTLLFKPGRLTADFLKGRRQRSLSPLRVYIAATLVFFVLVSFLDPIGRIQTGSETLSDGRHPDSLVVVQVELARVEREMSEADSARSRYDVAVRDTVASVVSAATDGLEAIPGARAVADSILRAANAGGPPDWSQLDWGDGDPLSDDFVDAIEDAIDDVDEPPSSRDQLGLVVEASILRALPADSLVRLGDIQAARVQVVPDINMKVGLPEWMPRSAAVDRLGTARGADARTEALTEIGRAALRQLPTSLFLLLPLFALLLKLVYVRRDWYYSEHLVFGFHVHAAAFLILTLALLPSVWMSSGGTAGESAFASYLVGMLLASIPVYYLIASWRVYRQGVFKTLAKGVVVGVVYGLSLIILGATLTLALALISR